MRLPSASRLERALNCPASCVLPEGERVSSEAAATTGTDLHAYIEYARTGRKYQIDDPATARVAERMDLSAIPDGMESEVAFGLNPLTFEATRYRLLDGPRKYPLDGWMHGQSDLAGVSGEFAVIVDLKTGRNPVSAFRNPQLYFLATCLAKLVGVKRARVAIFTLLQDSGSWAQDWVELTEFDLAEFDDELREGLDTILEADTSYDPIRHVRAGWWCKYCRCAASCPAQAGLIRSAPPSSTLPAQPSEVAALYGQILLVEGAIETARKQILRFVKDQGGKLILSDGRVLRVTHNSTTKILPGAAEFLGAEAPMKLDPTALTADQEQRLERAGLLTTAPTAEFLKVYGKEKKK